MKLSGKTGFWVVALLTCTMAAQAQDTIHVKGYVYEKETHNAVNNLMVVNMRSQEGGFVPTGGRLSLTILKTDTIIVAATGYTTMKLSFTDSAAKPEYNIRIVMKRLEITLKPVEIFTQRDLEEIQKDIETLGYDEHDYMIGGASAFESPITYLYEQFSRRERNKREVAEMRNNDRRRALLKELFRKYVDNDIIQLKDEEFDDFIDFCRVSDDFIKSSTQYDFIMYIKKRYELYRMINRE
ncbi:MAG TPA: hypothetical protein VFW78_06225 [Bacteroidia bacterium]|nr:hypothetical protein [Bacteroidia bacterium]